MVIDARSAADEIGAALETGRRELAKVDLEKVRDDALSAARSALPLNFHLPRRQRRRRWPLVAVILALVAAAMGWAFLPGLKTRVMAAIADRRRIGAESDEPDLAPTLDVEMAPEMRQHTREMAGSLA
jgi:ferric-dicitrate binding protein FerR (iron transport regulator)